MADPSHSDGARSGTGEAESGGAAPQGKLRWVTDHFAVAPQLSPEDLDAAAAEGVRTVIANRPDGEGGVDQPRMGAMRAKAESLGLSFAALPFSGAPTPEIIERMSAILSEAPAPALAYCRTGTRSVTAWALAHGGQGNADDIIAAAAGAGYDLSPLREFL